MVQVVIPICALAIGKHINYRFRTISRVCFCRTISSHLSPITIQTRYLETFYKFEQRPKNDVILCLFASNHFMPMHISGSIFYIILVCVISVAVNIGRFLEFRVSITYDKTNQMDIKYNITDIQSMSQTQNIDSKNNFTTQPSSMSSSATSESKDGASLRNR